MAALLRYSSLSALIAFAAAPAYLWLWADPQKMEFSILMALLIWMRHHENIARLLRGEEPRIGASRT